MSNYPDLSKKLEIVETPEFQEVQNKPSTSSGMSGDRPPKRSGRRSGRRSSKLDGKAKLERSRQSARECRARKKLRYQYLEDLVLNREKAVFALRDELELYKQWCILLDKGKVPVELLKLLGTDDDDDDPDASSGDDSNDESDIDVEHITNDNAASTSTSDPVTQVGENSFAKLTLDSNQFQSHLGRSPRTSTINSKSGSTCTNQSRSNHGNHSSHGATGFSSRGYSFVNSNNIYPDHHYDRSDGNGRHGIPGGDGNVRHGIPGGDGNVRHGIPGGDGNGRRSIPGGDGNGRRSIPGLFAGLQSRQIDSGGLSQGYNVQDGTDTWWPSRACHKPVLEDTNASLPTILEDIES